MRIKKKESQSEIFTGSMADISFLLIIYFMITSAFSATRGLDFALPEDTDTPEIKQEDSIDVHVLRGGVIEVDGKGMPLEGLLPYCLEKLGGSQTYIPVRHLVNPAHDPVLVGQDRGWKSDVFPEVAFHVPNIEPVQKHTLLIR